MAEPELRAEEILELEFEYARETAGQAQNDRTTVVNLYLLLVGGVGSVILGIVQLGTARTLELPNTVYAVLFALLGAIGFFTFMKLVRLRQSWYDSVLAMNTIKDYYIDKLPHLEKAFRWRTHTIPPPGKPWTITFDLALLVGIIDSLAIALAVHFSGLHFPVGNYTVEALAAVLFLIWQIWYYFFQLPIGKN